ncbi:MAG: sulfotransferase, partial [Steroidobacteraceae bacterium]
MTEFEIPEVQLTERALLAEATHASGGLTDFGDETFKEPLRVLLAALNCEARLHKAGRFGRYQRMTQLLVQRLLLADLVKRHPEIHEQKIRQPLFVLGLQRTGSTKLQKVLATDTRWHTPVLWETLSPAPLPGEQRGDPGMRIAVAKQFVDMVYAIAPEVWAGHPMMPEEVEEETFAVEMSFCWTVPATFANVPSYIDWVEAHTAVPTYRYLKLIIQAWQWQRGTERPWILKAPWHIGFLDAILEVFPDASIVQCHRDPLYAIASSCALMYAGLKLSTEGLDKKR